jgi:RimJ/RimL family protein N-acetyltransferase
VARCRARLRRRGLGGPDAGPAGRIVGQLHTSVASYGVAGLGMVVAAEWRGRGVGRALLTAAFDWARRHGAHKMALECWPHNMAALALYESAGFRREGYLDRHYRRRDGQLWGAVVMGRMLD